MIAGAANRRSCRKDPSPGSRAVRRGVLVGSCGLLLAGAVVVIAVLVGEGGAGPSPSRRGATLPVAVTTGSSGPRAEAATSATSATIPPCTNGSPGPGEIDGVPGCLAAQFPDDYAGIHQTGFADMTILEVHPTAALQSAAVSGFVGYQVSFATARYTLAQLQQVQRTISATLHTVEDRPFGLLSVGVNQETNQVHVTVTEHTTLAAATRYFTEGYPAGMVTVTATVPQTASPRLR